MEEDQMKHQRLGLEKMEEDQMNHRSDLDCLSIIQEEKMMGVAPVTGKMFKGLCLCYMVVTSIFFSVAVSGYWAVGNRSSGIVLTNFLADGRPIVPR
ncbi:putative GABA transporter 2 [Acorus calamus]|uniref:GABA transporter 2 n=1 Tax=Acorus calamus TaxID=4465 RepID=A0AAV9FBE1_ACOCL|nr:putative GABA transporter 2 [Acorus calamus]